MSDIEERNSQVIEDFRKNGGKVGGRYEGAPLLLLNTTGAKSGKVRTTPLAYLLDGESMVVAASKLGSPNHPDWYHNLVAHPQVTVEVGGETLETTAIVAQGAERERLWSLLAAKSSMIDEHQARTTRPIPLVILKR